MIKGSLLCSVPIVQRFGRKFVSPKMGRKFEVWGFRRGKILTLTIRPPRKSIPTETRHLAQKRCWSVQNCYLQRRARNSSSHFTPLPGRPCRADLYHFWLVVSYRRRNHSCEILSRLVKRLGDYGSPKSGVSHWLWMSLLQQCYARTCYTVINSHWSQHTAGQSSVCLRPRQKNVNSIFQPDFEFPDHFHASTLRV